MSWRITVKPTREREKPPPLAAASPQVVVATAALAGSVSSASVADRPIYGDDEIGGSETAR